MTTVALEIENVSFFDLVFNSPKDAVPQASQTAERSLGVAHDKSKTTILADDDWTPPPPVLQHYFTLEDMRPRVHIPYIIRRAIILNYLTLTLGSAFIKSPIKD